MKQLKELESRSDSRGNTPPQPPATIPPYSVLTSPRPHPTAWEVLPGTLGDGPGDSSPEKIWRRSELPDKIPGPNPRRRRAWGHVAAAAALLSS